MFDQFLIIDYPEGAGGEYLSNCFNNHAGFYNEQHLYEQPQYTDNTFQKFINGQCLIGRDFNIVLQEFLIESQQRNIKKFCIPCHLYKYPDKITTIKNKIPNVRFIKIDVTGHEYLVKLDFIRKVYFRKLTKLDLSYIAFRSKNLKHDQKIQISNLLKNDMLLGLDFDVLAKHDEITTETRQQTLATVFNSNRNPPSVDISVNYGDLFINVDNIKNTYYNLCNQLNIIPNKNILDNIVKRNQKNMEDLKTFSNNFEMIKQQMLTY